MQEVSFLEAVIWELLDLVVRDTVLDLLIESRLSSFPKDYYLLCRDVEWRNPF